MLITKTLHLLRLLLRLIAPILFLLSQTFQLILLPLLLITLLTWAICRLNCLTWNLQPQISETDMLKQCLSLLRLKLRVPT